MANKRRKASQFRGEHLKDEIYRQMFRLEAGRAGASIALAVALLRAWVAADSQREDCETRQWLLKISPICIEMIEPAIQHGGPACPSVQ
jgi:hypothetical protein